jgi:hypothetical protein
VQAILFFDDFLIHRGPDVERRFHTPQWQDEVSYTDSSSPYGMGYASVVAAPEGGYYLYYVCLSGEETSDEHGSTVICMAQSDDGLTWQPLATGVAREGLPENVLLSGTPKPGGWWAYRDANPAAQGRYLTTNSPILRDPSGNGLLDVPSVLLESWDGLNWNVIPEAEFLPHHSDTCNAVVYNPIKGRYQITIRRRWGERRVFQVESDDLVKWTAPHPVVHPSPIDPPSTHFYGMPQFFIPSAGLFVGFLWLQHMPYNDVMGGPVTTEYAYSYDGDLWNRTHTIAMPRREPGTFGGGSLYGTAMIEREEDVIVYAVARVEEHHAIPRLIERGQQSAVLLSGTLRKHGFVGLVSNRGRGEITTECLLIDRPEITINVNAPLGGVRVQLCDTGYRPLPGCTYEDCREIQGDHVSADVVWGDGVAFRRIVESKQWVRIQVELEHAEIFSIDTECAVAINPKAPVRRDL